MATWLSMSLRTKQGITTNSKSSGSMRRGFPSMKRVRIIWVGKTREPYLTDGIGHYLRLLNHMAHLSIVEVKDERGRERQAGLVREGERILKQAGPSFILLDETGGSLSSREFADFLRVRDAAEFVLGGAYGVSEEVRRKAASIISLSRMTLTHEMARLVFLEQLFRAETILRGMEYHH